MPEDVQESMQQRSDWGTLLEEDQPELIDTTIADNESASYERATTGSNK